MAEVSDPATLRPLLDTDRAWALYLLGDLEPHLRQHARWWSSGDAVVLLYHRFDPPVLLAFGPPDAVRPLLDEVAPEPQLHLHVRPEILALVRERHDVPAPKRMLRMSHDGDTPRGRLDPRITRLSAADLPLVEALYRDGEAHGERPDFFTAEMLSEGVYFGRRAGDALCAVAGTHLVAPSAGAAAIGNVYTRRDRRGEGLAGATTAAVLATLVEAGVRTIGLSVREDNAAARRVYERLGFRPHCPFIEGLARRRP